MATGQTSYFLAGVIEGFYGQPWTQRERFELFDWMAGWRLNTYLYAPKDDLKHRAIWREPYSASEQDELRQLIERCQQRDIRFIYALSPGLDIRYDDEAELDCLRNRFEQMLAMKCQHFALLFDDIPDHLELHAIQRWGSLASAQCHVANTMFKWIQERQPDGHFLFCPTAYCGRLAQSAHGGRDYLPTLGRELSPEIDVFWTGPEIISHEITIEHIEELRAVLRRKPLIWDNLHANDYDGRRFYCGPYAGRPPALRSGVNGVLANPNNEFALNYVPLRTLAEFLRCPATPEWNARKAYLSAMREWLPHFATVGGAVTLEDLILFGDCYYLPHREGPEAEALYERAKGLLTGDSAKWSDEVAAFRQQAVRLREFCLRMATLRHRPLFYALSRRLWELREEVELIERCIESKFDKTQPNAAWRSDSHLPGTYRGGMVARLQRLLSQQIDGTFRPMRGDGSAAWSDNTRQPPASAV
jgi:protein O-GlcNAcase/histone acetyltransferase